MDSNKSLQVGVSASLIDLKAELLRKQQELKSARSGRSGVIKSAKKSDLLKAKSKEHGRNKGIDTRSQKDRLQAAEEERNLEKSKSTLEAKAKLYEKMQASALLLDDEDEDGTSATSQLFSQSLVNFQQKAIDDIQERRKSLENKRKLEESEESKSRHEPLYPVNEDEWTEFTDALGRTRKCLKVDLPSFIEREEKLERPENPGICLSASADDRLREMKREKWELEAELLAAKEKVHYQDVLFDEVRTHGTGYYKFDRDDNIRAQQMRDLKKLSEQTAESRQKIKKEKSTKKSQLKAKLLKIKNRKRAKAGLPPLPDSESDNDDDEDDKSDAEKESKDEVKKPAETRAWDFGKCVFGVFGPRPSTFDELDEKWLKDRRSDRNPEFAPPTSIYSQGGLRKLYNTSSQPPSSSGGKYQNFVKSKEPLPSTSSANSCTPVVTEPTPKPFQAPENFWKQRKDSRVPPQKPIPIVDELPAPVPESNEEFDRGMGVEVAPPPTFEYYHGEGKPKGRREKGGQSDEYVLDAVSTGLKALREQYEAKQHKAKPVEKVFPQFL